jgi:hypothetical protein
MEDPAALASASCVTWCHDLSRDHVKMTVHWRAKFEKRISSPGNIRTYCNPQVTSAETKFEILKARPPDRLR